MGMLHFWRKQCAKSFEKKSISSGAIVLHVPINDDDKIRNALINAMRMRMNLIPKARYNIMINSHSNLNVCHFGVSGENLVEKIMKLLVDCKEYYIILLMIRPETSYQQLQFLVNFEESYY